MESKKPTWTLLEPIIRENVTRIAMTENRSVSAMIRILVKEALKNREEVKND